MTEVDYIMDDIRDAVEGTLSNKDNDYSKYNSSVDSIVEKVRILITPELDKRQKESEKHESHADNCEDTIEELESELEEAKDEIEEIEESREWLSLVDMFRKAGGYVHDVRYGVTPAY